MAWIELHQSVWTHKKTVMLSAFLDIDELYAAAHMSKLWTWALDNAPDGDLSNLPNKVIAFGAGWKGDADQFVDALIQAEWVDRSDSETTLHDWFDYAGRLIEKREANKNRMREARSKKFEQRATNVQHTNNERAGATVPDQTIPNQNNTTTAREESQRQVINAYKRVKNRDLTPFQLGKLMAYIDNEGFDHEVIVNAIERAGVADSSGIRLIETIINDYADVNAKTLDKAKAFDADFDARKKNRGDPRKGQSAQINMLDKLAKEFEQYETG